MCKSLILHVCILIPKDFCPYVDKGGVVPYPFKETMGARIVQLNLPAVSAPRAKVLGPRVLPSALRIPARGNADLIQFPRGNPALYVHEGSREILLRKFIACFGGPVVMSISDNRQAMISHASARGCLSVRIHHMFLDAPCNIQDALVRYVVLADKEASQALSVFIHANAKLLVRRKRSRIPLETKGKTHDLLSIATDLQARYFPGTARPLITWGAKAKRAANGQSAKQAKRVRKTIRLGSYDASERIVRIHRVLDRVWVPRYFVAFVLYHELLHHHMPATYRGHRRMLHPPEFLELERSFRFFERATAWEKRNRARLLRA
jgi:hypothetical protein